MERKLCLILKLTLLKACYSAAMSNAIEMRKQHLNADEEAKAQSYIDKALDVNKVDINKVHEILRHMGGENKNLTIFYMLETSLAH